ncbi:MAG TPA: O-antigen ligase family protein [Gammaproteobacteria bacterium]|nr:O-antigen ligase family protein [Gammaproteobacteria bacterium]
MTDQTWGWWRHQAAATGPTVGIQDGIAPEPGGAIPFWALMAFTLLLLLSPQSFVPAIGALHLPLLSALLAAGTYVLRRSRRHLPIFGARQELKIAATLAGWAIVTVPLSMWPGGSVAFFFSIFFKALVVFWLLTAVVDTPARLRIVIWILSLIAVPLSVSAVRGFFSGAFRAEELTKGLDRISGYNGSLTGNPNDLALMLNLILPLTIALFLCTRRLPLKLLLAVIVVLDMVAVVATFSRAGFLALGVIGLSFLVLLFKRGQKGLAMGVIAAALVSTAFVPSSYYDRLSTITNIQADTTNSAQNRLRDNIIAVKYVATHPVVGAGIGMNILMLNNARGADWTKVHNVYLEYAVDLGLPGVGIFVFLIYTIARKLRRASREIANLPALDEVRTLLQGLGVSLAGFALSAIFYPDAYQFYFYYIAGLAIAATSIAFVYRDAGSAQAEPEMVKP